VYVRADQRCGVTDREALECWAGLCAGGRSDGYHLVRLHEEDGQISNGYVRVQLDELPRLSRITLRRPVDALVGMVPRTVRDPLAVQSGSMLWVCVTGTKSNGLLERFRPVPSIVLREGDTSRRTAAWPLRKALPYEWLERANRRLAHHLRAPKVTCAPETLLAPPGASVMGERKTPTPIVVERFEMDGFLARDVVKRLRDAPDPHAWRDAA
jgi:hypothetical protein